MGNEGRRCFEQYREIVYALLRRYTDALDDPDDHAVATLARAELPRYMRYWVGFAGRARAHCRWTVPELG